MTTLTFVSVQELNAEVAKYRSAGLKVSVKKVGTEFVASVDGGGRKASPDSERKFTAKAVDENTFFYSICDWKKGAEDAECLRAQGKTVKYFKATSGKCWVLKVN
jgi:hypothetical protein